ncbi:ABC transporter ATP-binding protein [Clostridium paraputrificum]|uniref:ABC transporter ATP-binding protein n=1 Tax=Clostridium paraputrificum TaxID=29363 RepID=UPI000C0886AA|nr:ABC transporter ATP-binding protein [Clostridium paraputrificum]
MIKVEGINFSYNKNEEFINDLSVEFENGKITTILGPNGSGKSTLLSLLCGLNNAKSGSIFIDGKDITKLKYKDIAKIVATVHQQNSVPNDITVRDLVSYGRLPFKKRFEHINRDDEKIINWALKETGLEGMEEKLVMSMSGGERQRVFIAMALVQKPKILFLDEPTTYLDIYHQIEILELVQRLNKDHGTTIVMVLHDINQAIKYSDNVAVMKDGALVKEGRANDIINENLIRKVYGVSGIMEEVNGEVYYVPEKTCLG